MVEPSEKGSTWDRPHRRATLRAADSAILPALRAETPQPCEEAPPARGETPWARRAPEATASGAAGPMSARTLPRGRWTIRRGGRGIEPQNAAMGQPSRKPATYDDVRNAQEGSIAEIIAGALHVQPRPAVEHSLAASGLGGSAQGARPVHASRTVLRDQPGLGVRSDLARKRATRSPPKACDVCPLGGALDVAARPDGALAGSLSPRQGALDAPGHLDGRRPGPRRAL